MSTNMMLLMGRLVIGMVIVGVTSTYVGNRLDQQGVVTGILYITEEETAGIQGSSIVVDGQILRHGETIHGAEVVRIERFCVEFEKNGTRWKQRVRQKPNPAWEQLD